MDPAESRKRVMVVIDESQSSYRTLMWVLDNLGKSLMANPNSLIIFMAHPLLLPSSAVPVSPSLGIAGLYFPASPTSEYVKSAQEIEKKVAIGLLEKAKSICTRQGISAETVLVEGDAKMAICSTVDKYSISMLVLAEQHLGRVRAAFAWSTSDYCVQYARCPVLVVKNPK